MRTLHSDQAAGLSRWKKPTTRSTILVVAAAMLGACSGTPLSPEAQYQQALRCEGLAMEYVVLAMAVAVPGQVTGGTSEDRQRALQEAQEFAQGVAPGSSVLIERGEAIGLTQAEIIDQRREATNAAEARVREKRHTLGTWDAALKELAALRSTLDDDCPEAL